jgi:hypothetical protein
MLSEILERYPEDDFLKADGFDEAILGVCEKENKLIYSVRQCIEILKKDMEHEEAIEYFYFNMEGAYVGEQTPIWCMDIL